MSPTEQIVVLLIGAVASLVLAFGLFFAFRRNLKRYEAQQMAAVIRATANVGKCEVCLDTRHTWGAIVVQSLPVLFHGLKGTQRRPLVARRCNKCGNVQIYADVPAVDDGLSVKWQSGTEIKDIFTDKTQRASVEAIEFPDCCPDESEMLYS